MNNVLLKRFCGDKLSGGEDSNSDENIEVDLAKEVVLYLKRNDLAPLNCTISFMSQEIGKPPTQIHKTVQELVGDGVVAAWLEYQKGVLTPYKIVDLPRLIDKGTEFTYDEIEFLTSTHGGYPENAPAKAWDSYIKAKGGESAPGEEKILIISQWSKDNLAKMARKFKHVVALRGFDDKVKPKRPPLSKVADEGFLYDVELGYLNTFFRSIFLTEEMDPLYALYASEGEDLRAFRKRTVTALVKNLAEMSKSLLEKLGRVGPGKGSSEDRRLAAPYLYFFASMVNRYAQLSKAVGVQTRETKNLINLRAKILDRAGEM